MASYAATVFNRLSYAGFVSGRRDTELDPASTDPEVLAQAARAAVDNQVALKWFHINAITGRAQCRESTPDALCRRLAKERPTSIATRPAEGGTRWCVEFDSKGKSAIYLWLTK